MNREYLNPFSKYTECEQAKCNHFSFSQCYCKCHECHPFTVCWNEVCKSGEKNASRPQDVERKPKQRVFQFSSALNVINTWYLIHFFDILLINTERNKLKQKHIYSVVTLNLFHFRNFDSLRACINSLKTIKKTSLTIKPTLKRLELLVTYVHEAVQYRECP